MDSYEIQYHQSILKLRLASYKLQSPLGDMRNYLFFLLRHTAKLYSITSQNFCVLSQ